MGSGLLVLKNMWRTCYSLKKYYFYKNLFGKQFWISDLAAAALANGLMKDLGVISEGNTVELLDPKKIHWEKRRTCARTVNECEPNWRSRPASAWMARRTTTSLSSRPRPTTRMDPRMFSRQQAACTTWCLQLNQVKIENQNNYGTVESLQSLMILTMSHWSSGLTCLLPATRVTGSNPLGGTYVNPGFSC